MLSAKDHLIYPGSFIMDSKYIYLISKIDITEVITAQNIMNIDKDIQRKIKTYPNFEKQYKVIYNLGDAYSKRYYALKRYKIFTHTVHPINGKVAVQFCDSSYFTLLDKEYIDTLIKNTANKLSVYMNLLNDAEKLAPPVKINEIRK